MGQALRRYYRGATLAAMEEVQTGRRLNYHFDHQGTVQCLTDDTGAVTDRFASDAWGVPVKRTGTSINRQWYVGNLGYYRQVDQALDYMRARYYVPRQARWMSTDPFRQQWLSVSLIDPETDDDTAYSYVSNRPTLMVDPSGLVGIRRQPNTCTTIGNCGGATFAVSLNPESRKSGWIIQHVKVKGTVYDCADPPTPFTPNHPPLGFEYWEAWPVRGGRIGFCTTSGQFGYLNPSAVHDTFRLQSMSEKSKGTWGLYGQIKFHPVTPGTEPNCRSGPSFGKWLPPPCAAVPYWQVGLWCQLGSGPPRGLNTQGSKAHTMIVTWDCCTPPCGAAPKVASVVCHP